MKNPTFLIWSFCCGTVLLPILLGLGTYRLLFNLAKRRPVILFRKTKENGILTRLWQIDIQEHEPMAKEEKDQKDD